METVVRDHPSQHDAIAELPLVTRSARFTDVERVGPDRRPGVTDAVVRWLDDHELLDEFGPVGDRDDWKGLGGRINAAHRAVPGYKYTDHDRAGMRKEVVRPPGLAEPRGFEHGLLVDGGQVLFLAGQDASGPDGDIVAPGDIVGQFERVLENLAAVCREAGGTSEDIVKLNVYVADRDEYRANLGALGEVFAEYVDDYPAMALFEVSGFFQADALVEAEGFAVVEHDETE